MKKAKKDRIGSPAKTLDPGDFSLTGPFETVPEIRWEKVSLFRRMLAEKEWNPESEKVVEKMLIEHLS